MSATAPSSDNQAVSNQDIQQILTEVRGLNRRMDTLNTRLFGNPEGDAGDEGRLVVLERRTNNHSGRITKLEQFRWYLLVRVRKIRNELLHARLLVSFAKGLTERATAAEPT